MARRGRAELAIILQAKDEASAVVNKVNSQVKALEKDAKKLNSEADKGSQSAKGLGDAWKSVVDQGEKVDKVRTRVEMLRSIAMFAIPVVTGLVGALVSMANAKVPIDRATEALKALEAQSAAAAASIFDMVAAQGLLTDEEVHAEKVRRQQVAATEKLREAELALFEAVKVRGKIERELDDVRRGDLLFSIDSEEELAEAVAFATQEINKQQGAYDAMAASVAALNEALATTSELQGFEAAPGADEGSAPFGNLAAKTEQALAKARKGGRPAGKKVAKNFVAEFLKTSAQELAVNQTGFGAFLVKWADGVSENIQREQGPGIIAAILGVTEEGFDLIPEGLTMVTDHLRELREESERTLEVWQSFGDVVGDAVDTVLPGMGGAVSDLAGIWSKYSEGQVDVQQATVGTIDTVGNAIASQIEDETALMAVLAIKELGLGIATAFVNPVESASHFAAAAVFGGAAIASAVSGGAAAGDADTAADEGSGVAGGGGGVTYIFNSGVVDGQSVQLSLARASRAGSGTGLSERRGV